MFEPKSIEQNYEQRAVETEKAEFFTKIKDAFSAYETGKTRRYGLLFAVNGGTFAIAKLFSDAKSPQDFQNIAFIFLSAGMVWFTKLMYDDIYAFGEKMRIEYLPGVFGEKGKNLLKNICILLIAGWVLFFIATIINLFHLI